MARVVIEITDNPDGTVTAKATPNLAAIMDAGKRGAGLTSAQAYAVSALLHIRDESRAQLNQSAPPRLILPPGLES